MGFIDNLFGRNGKQTESKKSNDENKTFAKNFKLFWETQRFVEAKEVCAEWVKKYPKDIDCLYAVIIVNATMDTIPNSELNNSFLILKQQNGSELTYWYKDMAERAIAFQAQEELAKSNYGGAQHVFRVR